MLKSLKALFENLTPPNSPGHSENDNSENNNNNGNNKCFIKGNWHVAIIG